MYIVVSKWQVNPGQDEAFASGTGRAMREWLRKQPAVEFVYEGRTEDGNVIAVLGYTDRASYEKLILADNSPFEQKARELNLDQLGKWLWSERAEAVAEPAMA